MAPVKMNRAVGLLVESALLLIAAGTAGAARADEADTLRLVARMESYYRKSPGITADFVQILESRTLGRPQEESGTLSLKPPGKMRWEYSNPRGKIAVTDGAHAFLYLPEDRQVIVGTIGEMDSGAVTSRLLLGGAPLSRDFKVEGERSPEKPGIWLVKLTPRSGDFPYDSVSLDVEDATGAIRSIRLLDPLGNRMEYRFDHLQVVRTLPDRIFTYKIPRGADVQVMGEGSAPSAPP
jgi:outer membrane lipoprotein carrier protein